MAKKRKKEIETIEGLHAKVSIIDDEINDHPYRMFPYSGRDEAAFEADLKAPTHLLESSMKKNGASKNDIEFAKKRRTDIYVRDLYVKKANFKKDINRLLSADDGRKGDMFLLDNNSAWLLDQFAALFTKLEVLAKLKEEKGLVISKISLVDWCKQNDEKIRVHVTNYQLENKTDKLRIGNDVGRLLIMNKHLNFWDNKVDLNNEKGSSTATNMVIKILDQARKETKGEVVTINGQIDIKASVQATESVDSILSKVSINDIVVGLVAAQQGISPLSIMSALTSSYYSKFNGFNSNPTENEIPDLPSKVIKSFNWGNLESNVRNANPLSKSISEVTEKGVMSNQKETRMQKMLAALSNLQFEVGANEEDL